MRSGAPCGRCWTGLGSPSGCSAGCGCGGVLGGAGEHLVGGLARPWLAFWLPASVTTAAPSWGRERLTDAWRDARPTAGCLRPVVGAAERRWARERLVDGLARALTRLQAAQPAVDYGGPLGVTGRVLRPAWRGACPACDPPALVAGAAASASGTGSVLWVDLRGP
ncbi:hypothetical protein ACTIVE_6562 [Actinomadura verrucosospora]|uniref:Uncharacterized protein n=1 Tax=Actinomadura verrucosospora TaxID=46165 RepID=A0A7D3W350_ACTVE|nr:hypothetical protein ACTIVE_6562 [Actinomadura verrucosospora]